MQTDLDLKTQGYYDASQGLVPQKSHDAYTEGYALFLERQTEKEQQSKPLKI